jgi:hypothetical protein
MKHTEMKAGSSLASGKPGRSRSSVRDRQVHRQGQNWEDFRAADPGKGHRLEYRKLRDLAKLAGGPIGELKEERNHAVRDWEVGARFLD